MAALRLGGKCVFFSITFVESVVNLREKLSPGLGPGSNPGPGENFSLKLMTQDLLDGYSKS